MAEFVIAPTTGRQVRYNDGTRTLEGTISEAKGDRLVDLQVIDVGGVVRTLTDVALRQPEDAAPKGAYCEYQPWELGAVPQPAPAQMPPGRNFPERKFPDVNARREDLKSGPGRLREASMKARESDP